MVQIQNFYFKLQNFSLFIFAPLKDLHLPPILFKVTLCQRVLIVYKLSFSITSTNLSIVVVQVVLLLVLYSFTSVWFISYSLYSVFNSFCSFFFCGKLKHSQQIKLNPTKTDRYITPMLALLFITYKLVINKYIIIKLIHIKTAIAKSFKILSFVCFMLLST